MPNANNLHFSSSSGRIKDILRGKNLLPGKKKNVMPTNRLIIELYKNNLKAKCS